MREPYLIYDTNNKFIESLILEVMAMDIEPETYITPIKLESHKIRVNTKRTRKNAITDEDLLILVNKRLKYLPLLGLFQWKNSHSNRILVGARAGTFNKKDGFYQISLDGNIYQQKNLVYLVEHGYIPYRIIHRDRNKANDVITNLQEIEG